MISRVPKLLNLIVGFCISASCIGQNTQIQAAKQLLDKGDYMQALIKLDSAVIQTPENAQVFELQGQARANLGDCTGAIESWDVFASIDKENSWKVDGLKADCYVQQGRHEEAIDAISKYLVHDPYNGPFYLMRGHEYYLISKYSQAIQDFTTIVDRKLQGYNTFEVFYKRGLAYSEFGMHQEALKDFNKVVELYPQFNYGYFYRGSAYWNLGEYHEAIADFTKAIQLDSKDLHSYFNRGLCYQSEKKYDLALADFSKVIQLDPEFDEAYNQAAMTTYYMGNMEAAEKSFNDYIAKFSSFSHAYYNRGMFYAERKQNKKALLDFESCIQLNPKDGDAYLQKALVLLELQKQSDACEALKQAETLGNADAKRMKKKTCGQSSN
ncbi:MAG TPA: tetratricopeptide repeat protein [Cytophagaceae bacterium]|jgi:tetratricopeptide (TPR) repeat protein|nr:tetratricopeptide repeat protein [Cytophagaceae bacterium]